MSGRHRAAQAPESQLTRGVMVVLGWVAGLCLTAGAVAAIIPVMMWQAARGRVARHRPVVFQAGQHR